MEYIVFDIETNGLLPYVDKLHCLCYEHWNDNNMVEKGILLTLNEINPFISKHIDKYFVGHNIIKYDFPVLEHLCNIKFPKLKVIDTLGISYYLYPIPQFKHGLESWGDRFGVPKPVIEDFKGISEEEERILDYFDYVCKQKNNQNV